MTAPRNQAKLALSEDGMSDEAIEAKMYYDRAWFRRRVPRLVPPPSLHYPRVRQVYEVCSLAPATAAADEHEHERAKDGYVGAVNIGAVWATRTPTGSHYPHLDPRTVLGLRLTSGRQVEGQPLQQGVMEEGQQRTRGNLRGFR